MSQPNEFTQEAGKKDQGMVRQLASYMFEGGKWWLLPIVLALLVVGLLLIAGGGAAAPFIYTLF